MPWSSRILSSRNTEPVMNNISRSSGNCEWEVMSANGLIFVRHGSALISNNTGYISPPRLELRRKRAYACSTLVEKKELIAINSPMKLRKRLSSPEDISWLRKTRTGNDIRLELNWSWISRIMNRKSKRRSSFVVRNARFSIW